MKKFITISMIAVIALVVAGTVSHILNDTYSRISDNARAELARQVRIPGGNIVAERAKSMISGEFTMLVLRIDQQNNLLIGNAPYSPEAFDTALDRTIGTLHSSEGWADKLVLVVESDPMADFTLVQNLIEVGMRRGIKMISGYIAGGSWHHFDLVAKVRAEQDKKILEKLQNENSN